MKVEGGSLAPVLETSQHVLNILWDIWNMVAVSSFINGTSQDGPIGGRNIQGCCVLGTCPHKY